ncbi:60s ribosomal l24 [Tubulinosema ratisbonensis]|uniref:60s ribosomal l24 n=1 Tax=Tubulinosema ratisbonensis TaxID=291195 RepID=A0A437AP87_9MICR|nr:60s ribosomal l24 [Tubulinosema ratisbonensis]
MIKEGICIFSGYEVKKGSGLIKVTNDTRTFLFANRKVLALVTRKANPKDIKWTQPSRIYHKKGEKKVEKKVNQIKVVKEVRGFPGVSKDLVNKEVKEVEKKPKKEKGVVKPTEKVSKAEQRKKF